MKKNIINICILLYVCCMCGMASFAAETQPNQPMRLGTYEYTDDELSKVYYENAAVMDFVVYQYRAETDSFIARTVDQTDPSLPKTLALIIRDSIFGRPVTEVDRFIVDTDRCRVTSITLPDTIRQEQLLFDFEHGGSSLQEICFAGNIKKVGLNSDPDASDLSKVTLADRAVSSGCFSGNTKLKTVEFPQGMKSVEKRAFTDCTSMIKLRLPDGVTKIGKEAFAGCKRLELYVPSTVKSIGKNALGSSGTGKIKMLYCVKKSAAYKYAKKNKIPCTLITKGETAGKIQKIEAVQESVTLQKGGTCYAEVCVKPFFADSPELLYKSSDPKAISVDSDGKITARKYGGKAVITITLAKNKKIRAKMTVRVEKHVFRLIRNNKICKFYLNCPKDGIAGYEIWQSDTKGGNSKRIARTKKNRFTVKYGKKAYYRIRPYKKNGGTVAMGNFSKAKKL